uniref:Uncharacterized protein n=1 Tax=Arundo donax TaxID=35708 RepID=A0A0A9EK65_ARUDO
MYTKQEIVIHDIFLLEKLAVPVDLSASIDLTSTLSASIDLTSTLTCVKL